jgi:SAM-dependent methyltransferase
MKNHVGQHTLQVMERASWYNNWIFSIIEPHLGEDILEVGAGIGIFTKLLSQEGKVTAIDINRKYISSLKENYKNVDVGFGNIESGEYFFKNRNFTSIICFNVLEHIKNEKKALANMFELLRTGGRLILLVPAHKILFSKFDEKLGHYRRYSKKEVKVKLKNSGFGEIKTFYFNWWAAIGWFIFLKLAKKQSLPSDKISVFDKLGKVFLWPEKFVRPPFGLSVIAIAQKQ